ncbi:MAG: DUF177 domain-containing protein [Myxococcota bacterium]|nr:DUF177 domain-containing protein [Myxococcota bacterium]
MAKDRTPMKIPVEKLSESPQRFSFEGSPQWWSERAGSAPALACSVEEPLSFAVDARWMGDSVLLEGVLRGQVEVECSRCLVRYRQPLSDGFRLILEPAGEGIPLDPESAKALDRDGVCLGDDLEMGSYRGTELDLEAYLAERVALNLPVQPVCREDCAGLCPRCGADRNTAGCDCVEGNEKSPFAALSTLLTEKNEGKN